MRHRAKSGPSEPSHCSLSFTLTRFPTHIRRQLGIFFRRYLPDITRDVRLDLEFPKVEHEALTHDVQKGRRNTAAFIHQHRKTEEEEEKKGGMLTTTEGCLSDPFFFF